MTIFRLFATLTLCAVALVPTAGAAAEPALERIKLPPGFEISLFAANVRDARSMALGDKGTLFVSTRTAGNVYAIRHDGKKPSEVITIASGLNMPNGIAVKDGALYVLEVSRVLRYDAIESNLPNPPKPVVVYDKFPTERHHGWKFARFGPDGWLYTQVGAPCNICDRGDPYAAIVRLKPDGSAMEIFARGVRNSVGFDWDPATKELWFTDNGRDMLGDDLPADELDRVTRMGEHFGYPFCHQGDSPDPEFGSQRACSEFTAPAAKLGAHVAALGMRFYGGTQFPAAYRGSIFIAEHGSWNRSRKVGYQVVRVAVDGQGRAGTPEPFLQGFLQVDATGRETVWGRPADVLPLPDGSLLVSDDLAGAIYRIRYGGA